MQDRVPLPLPSNRPERVPISDLRNVNNNIFRLKEAPRVGSTPVRSATLDL